MQATKLMDDEPGLLPAEVMEVDDQVSAPTEDEISALAYSYWEARGSQGGSPWEDWFRAETELKRALEEKLMQFECEPLADRLIRAGVPCAPIHDVPAALTDFRLASYNGPVLWKGSRHDRSRPLRSEEPPL